MRQVVRSRLWKQRCWCKHLGISDVTHISSILRLFSDQLQSTERFCAMHSLVKYFQQAWATVQWLAFFAYSTLKPTGIREIKKIGTSNPMAADQSPSGDEDQKIRSKVPEQLLLILMFHEQTLITLTIFSQSAQLSDHCQLMGESIKT